MEKEEGLILILSAFQNKKGQKKLRYPTKKQPFSFLFWDGFRKLNWKVVIQRLKGFQLMRVWCINKLYIIMVEHKNERFVVPFLTNQILGLLSKMQDIAISFSFTGILRNNVIRRIHPNYLKLSLINIITQDKN